MVPELTLFIGLEAIPTCWQSTVAFVCDAFDTEGMLAKIPELAQDLCSAPWRLGLVEHVAAAANGIGLWGLKFVETTMQGILGNLNAEGDELLRRVIAPQTPRRIVSEAINRFLDDHVDLERTSHVICLP